MITSKYTEPLLLEKTRSNINSVAIIIRRNQEKINEAGNYGTNKSIDEEIATTIGIGLGKLIANLKFKDILWWEIDIFIYC